MDSLNALKTICGSSYRFEEERRTIKNELNALRFFKKSYRDEIARDREYFKNLDDSGKKEVLERFGTTEEELNLYFKIMLDDFERCC